VHARGRLLGPAPSLLLLLLARLLLALLLEHALLLLNHAQLLRCLQLQPGIFSIVASRSLC